MMGELLEALKKYADSDYLPMHMPGHKRCTGEIGDPYFIDITEIEGFDNLHHAEGILLRAQERAAALYHSEETHYLVNGSTAGILAAVSGCTDFGGKLLMARNCHKSVYHAALLRGLQTVYLYPQSTGEMGINGVILPEDVENALSGGTDIQAVVITSPTYDGIVSDVECIAKIVHAFGIPLIVDEAHGAHFPFCDHFPKDSINCKADVVIHSLHKTLPALTQTALIHFNGPLIDRERLCRYLTVYQTSSPSYVLMAGLDECVRWISENGEIFGKFAQELEKLRADLRGMRHLKLLETDEMDPSKILISVRETGMHGRELAERLREAYHIETEMACGTYVCALTSAADTRDCLERLKEALFAVDRTLDEQKKASGGKKAAVSDEVIRTRSVCTLLEAENEEMIRLHLPEAGGRISGDFVTLYPPGIPILTPGEVITEAIVRRIEGYLEDGLEIEGLSGDRIRVFKRRKREENG